MRTGCAMPGPPAQSLHPPTPLCCRMKGSPGRLSGRAAFVTRVPEAHLRKHMLSIYVHDGAQALTLRVIGALSDGAAAELEQTWLTARSTLTDRELLVDLGDVIAVDTGGQTVLRRLASHGAKFITSSPLTDSLAEKASRRTPRALPARSPGVWSRFACCLRTACGVAKLWLRRVPPCGPIARKLW